ncbi:histidine kinase [Maribacter sp.]|nr:histidine kinase [Maribacter sp.]
MKRNRFSIFLVVCLSLYNTLVLAQNQRNLDSVLTVLSTMKENAQKVKTFGEVFEVYWNNKALDQANKYADSVRFLAEKLNNEEGIASSHFYLAKINQFEGNFDSAIVNLNFYRKFHKKKGDFLKLADAHFQLGKSFKALGNFEQSLSHLLEASSLYKKEGDRGGLAYAYNSIGGIYSKTNKTDEAINYYEKANALFKKLDKSKMYGMGLQNVGNVYARNSDFKPAIDNYTKGLDVIDKLDLDYEKSIILGNLGGAHTGLNEHEIALKYYLRAYDIKKKLPNKRGLAYALAGLGTSYMRVNRNSIANEKLDSALQLAKEVGSKDLIAQVLELKADASLNQNRYLEAYENIVLSNIWRDSVYNEKSDSRISKLRIEYETAQKDQEIVLLTKENEVQLANAKQQKTMQKALIGGLLLLGIIAALIFYSLRSRLKNQKLLAAKNEEIRLSQIKEQLGTLEMKALRAQMNPHFLFNCMNSINRMIMEEENDRASKYLSKFSKLVRLMLENSETPKVTLKDELVMLKSYIELESIRFKNKMAYKVVVAETIDQESTFIPSMVLQPFVENAIWHGLLHKNSRGLLTIEINEVDDNLHCTITDNGIGREKSLKLQKQSGHKKISMGIKITTDRLKLLTKQKIKDAIKILDLKDEENRALGTRVDILIPIS